MTSRPRFQASLLALLGVAAAASYVGAAHPVDLTFHHAGTLVGGLGLAATMRRSPLSDGAFACVVGFLLLHVFGAHWLYSSVPYDAWSEAVLGTSLSEVFGWRRNHYDRLVHVAFGLLMPSAIREVLRARARLSPGWARVLALDLVLSASAVYEVLEWGIAVVADPERAERYNGQQGDFFDAQKDVALAALGALVSTGVSALRRPREASRA